MLHKKHKHVLVQVTSQKPLQVLSTKSINFNLGRKQGGKEGGKEGRKEDHPQKM